MPLPFGQGQHTTYLYILKPKLLSGREVGFVKGHGVLLEALKIFLGQADG